MRYSNIDATPRLYSPPFINAPKRRRHRRDPQEGMVIAALGAGTLLVVLTVTVGAILVHAFHMLHLAIGGGL